MIIRKPTAEDAQALYDCIMPYAALSWQARTTPVNPDVVRASIEAVVEADNFVALLAEDEKGIAGFGFGYFGHSWWSEPDAGVDFFYVAQDRVGQGVARLLSKALVMAFKEKGCGYMYAGAESDISETNTKLYQNLWKKHGFHDIGGGRMILNLRGL
jgi:GNAT superfamily N-acetyltransferase